MQDHIPAPVVVGNLNDARRIVSVEALKLVEAMVDSLDADSGFAEAMAYGGAPVTAPSSLEDGPYHPVCS